MLNKKIKPTENFYVAGVLALDSSFAVVRHHEKNMIKATGGTYRGLDFKDWVDNNECIDHYNINSPTERKKKIEKTLSKVFGFFRGYRTMIAWLDDTFSSPYEFHLMIEMMEEKGIIVEKLEELYRERYENEETGAIHTKIAYKILQAQTVKNNSVIAIQSLEDLPQEGIDFKCQDPDIKDAELTLSFQDVERMITEESPFMPYFHRKLFSTFLETLPPVQKQVTFKKVKISEEQQEILARNMANWTTPSI